MEGVEEFQEEGRGMTCYGFELKKEVVEDKEKLRKFLTKVIHEMDKNKQMLDKQNKLIQDILKDLVDLTEFCRGLIIIIRRMQHQFRKPRPRFQG